MTGILKNPDELFSWIELSYVGTFVIQSKNRGGSIQEGYVDALQDKTVPVKELEHEK